MTEQLVYLCGIAGHPATSPALEMLEAAGWDVVVPELPGFDGRSGFQPPDDHLGWLTVVWDALDATGALPCPVDRRFGRRDARRRPRRVPPGGGHRARPARPVRDLRRGQPGTRPLRACRRPSGWPTSSPRACPSRSSIASPTSVPTTARWRRYISDVAAASLIWPLGDRGQARRLHRITCPTLILWGDQDELLPVAGSARWADRPDCRWRSCPAPAICSNGTRPRRSPPASARSSPASRRHRVPQPTWGTET